MLPWLFAVLVVLNAGLFIWGYNREKSLEPPPTPVPEGSYEIKLLEEEREEPQGPVAKDRLAPQTGQSAEGEAEEIDPAPDDATETEAKDQSEPRDETPTAESASEPSEPEIGEAAATVAEPAPDDQVEESEAPPLERSESEDDSLTTTELF